MSKELPCSTYGVIQRDQFSSDLDEQAEQIRRIGYSIVDSGYSVQQLDDLAVAFDRARHAYIDKYGEARLKQAKEFHTMRALLTHGGKGILQLAVSPNLLHVLNRLIAGKYVLNQQNGIVNPARESYNQGSWHRDLPYQHFVSDSPLAVNALFCVDDFTSENGATFVLPASHKAAAFPSQKYVESNAIQIEAKRGHFIVMDCMLFHAGGANCSDANRRGINHMYTIPYFKQQIDIPAAMPGGGLSDQEKEILGYNYSTPDSVAQYIESRSSKNA